MFANLLKKELREVLTIGNLIVVIVLAFVYASIGGSIGNIEKEVAKKPVVAIVNMDRGEYGRVVQSSIESFAEVVYTGKDLQSGLDVLRNQSGSALLLVEENFTDSIKSGEKARIKIFWLLKGLGIMDTISSSVLENFASNVEKQITIILMNQYNVKNPQLVLDPVEKVDATIFQGRVFDGASPSQLLNLSSSQSTMTSVVIMMLIIMAGSTVISSMGLEKENKTLETLLTMPVKRSYIVFSKILAAAIAGLVMASIYMVGFSFYMKPLTASSTGNLDLTLSMVDYVLVGLSLFTALLCGISLAMFLGILSKDFKSAQTMTFPLTALAVFSGLITMFKDFSTLSLPLKIAVFAIPFTHPMLSIRNLLFENRSFVFYGCVYNGILAAFLVILITRIFNTDRLIVGIDFRKKRRARLL